MRKRKTSTSRVLQARARLSSKERRTQILEGAAVFFSQRGFAAQTAELAANLGISEGLIFKHFSTKAELIDEVEYHMFEIGWPKDWRRLLEDRSVDLAERISHFYLEQYQRFNRPEWIRVALMILLSGDVRPKTLMVREEMFHALETIMREIRFYSVGSDNNPLSETEWELAWHLHSSFLFILIRKHVMNVAPTDPAIIIPRLVRNFLAEFG